MLEILLKCMNLCSLKRYVNTIDAGTPTELVL